CGGRCGGTDWHPVASFGSRRSDGHVPPQARRYHRGAPRGALARCNGGIRGGRFLSAVTYHAYPTSAMIGDYIRAAAGLVPAAAMLAILPLGSITTAVLGGFAALLAGFGVRAIVRYRIRLEVRGYAL